MNILSFNLWTTPAQARALGFKHYARMYGLIPGYFEPKKDMWMPVSDVFAPVEWAVSWMWAILRMVRGEEPDFAFLIVGEL